MYNYEDAIDKVQEYNDIIDTCWGCFLCTTKSNSKYIITLSIYGDSEKEGDFNYLSSLLDLNLTVRLDNIKMVLAFKKAIKSMFQNVKFNMSEIEHTTDVLLKLIVNVKQRKADIEQYNSKIFKKNKIIEEHEELINCLKQDLSLGLSKEEIERLIKQNE